MKAVGKEPPENPPLESLTRREQEILELLAEGLTSKEIAERLTLAVSSVRWYVQQIYGKLGVNGKRQAIARACDLGLIQRIPAIRVELPPPFPQSQRSHLPAQLTSFIGREKEIATLRQIIIAGHSRLVTLTGAGGTGKTRLGLQVCAQVVNAFPDGVWLVELAPIGDPGLVAKTIAKTLGLQEIAGVPILETLSGYLEKRCPLLMLDNCEHLLADCARLVDALLRACPKLHILATSREILNVPGEISFRVPSLALADPNALPPLAELAQVEGIQLFVERAAEAAQEFRLEESNARDVAVICQRLDGIPLAIELAAARVRVMGVDQITARLNNVFRLLTGGARTVMPRQQTLKATIDWSFSLLSEKERLALQRLSVFAGGWTLEAAETVCADEDIEPSEVLDLLAVLVDKSLVMAVREGSDVRYHLLETIRQYANDKLLESGGSEAARNRHLTYFLHLSEEASPHLRGQGQQAEWLYRMEEELDNLRLAMNWSLATGDRIADGMHLFSFSNIVWHILHAPEGVEWVVRFLQAEEKERGSQPLECGVQDDYYLLGWCMAVSSCSYLSVKAYVPFSRDQMRAMSEECERLCREIGESADEDRIFILFTLSSYTKDEIECLRFMEEGLAIAHRLEHPLTDLYSIIYLRTLFLLAISRGEIEQASAYREESLAIARKFGALDVLAFCLVELGELCYYRGAYARGRAFFEESLQLCKKYGYRGDEFVTRDLLISSAVENTEDEQIYRRAQDSLNFFKETRDLLFWYEALNKFQIVEWHRGNFERSEEFAKQRSDLESAYHLGYGKYKTELWLGRAALTQKDLPRARQHLWLAARLISCDTSLEFRISTNLADLGILSWIDVVDALAFYHAVDGNNARAAALFGAEEEMYQRFHLGFPFRQRREHEEALASVRQVMGDVAFIAAWEAGRAMSLEQAVHYALKEIDQ